MALLIVGLLLWTLAHGIKIHAPARRAALAAQFGEGPVKAGMAVLVLLSVVLMVRGYTGAEYVEVWVPPAFLVHLNNLLMVVALAVYIAAPFPGHVRAWVRHPQITGVKIWAVAHLLVNGDLASVVLFGGLLLWAAAAMVGVNRRDGKGPKPAPGDLKGDLAHAGATAIVLAVVGWVHTYLGYWPFPG